MKDFVIRVVEVFAWLMIIFSTVGGYYMAYMAHRAPTIVPGITSGNDVLAGVLGGLVGFGCGCVFSGTWFVLSAIHKDIRTLREISVWDYRNRNNPNHRNNRKDSSTEKYESLSVQ